MESSDVPKPRERRHRAGRKVRAQRARAASRAARRAAARAEASRIASAQAAEKPVAMDEPILVSGDPESNSQISTEELEESITPP